MTKLTKKQFSNILNLMDIIPVTINRSVSPNSSVHEWDAFLQTEQDDMAGYGVYVLNKVLQSIVGSVSSKITKNYYNRMWLEANPEAKESDVQKREKWITQNEEDASRLLGLFEIIKNKQTELLENDNIHIKPKSEVEEEEGFTTWRPQEFEPFAYRSELTKIAAEKEGYPQEAIQHRIDFDKKIHKFVEDKMRLMLPAEPYQTDYMVYAKKILKGTSMYFERNTKKSVEFFEKGNDEQAKNSKARAENLKFACENIFKILLEAQEQTEKAA